MIESKTDDGDDVQPVAFECRVETMPAHFWFKVVTFLTFYDDASAIHATSKAVRDHTVGEWQRIVLPRRMSYAVGESFCGELFGEGSQVVWQRNLSGSKLSESLGNLTNLTVLNVSGNKLAGAASIRSAHFKLGKLM